MASTPATTTKKTQRSNSNNSLIQDSRFVTIPPQNPEVVLTHDIVRDTQTLHFQIRTYQAPSPEREYNMAMRGYFAIMSSSDSSSSDISGCGEEVKFDTSTHCLWQPRCTDSPKEPLYHLRLSVLKDSEGRGDCPSRRFVSFSRPLQFPPLRMFEDTSRLEPTRL